MNISYSVRLIAALSALTAWRWIVAHTRNLELYADEAQYWFWSLDPDWGYYSKPPMVAWLIRLGTETFGDGELGVRAATFVLWPLTAGVIFLLVRRLYLDKPWAEAAGFWAALTFATLPMVSLGSLLITTDGPLLLFWSLSLYFLVRVLQTGHWRDWLLLGVFVGLGLMSKFSMLFFAVALLVFLLVSPTRRPLLRTGGPYLAALMALAVMSPNFLWNATHDFVSYQHTAEISQLDRNLLHPDALMQFVLSQFGVFGPLTAAALLLLAARPRQWLPDESMRLLAVFSLVPLGVIIVLSLLSRAFANWAAFSYVAGSALVVVWWVGRGKRAWLMSAIVLNLLIGATVYHYHDVARALDIQLTRKTDPTYRLSGNRALGEAIVSRLAAHPDARLLGDDRKSFAVFLYYTRAIDRDALYLNPGDGISNHFALTADIKHHPQGEFLLVSKYAKTEDIQHWFAEAHAQPNIHIDVLPDYALKYRVWLVRDFKGY